MNIGLAALSSLDRSTIRVHDLAAQAHVLVVSAVDANDAVPMLRRNAGINVPDAPGVMHDTEKGTVFWLSPRSWLFRVADTDKAVGVIEVVQAGFPDRIIHAALYSDALHWLEISGPGAAALLARGGHLSLEVSGFPVGHIKRTLIADIPLLIWRREPETWEVACERSRSRYFREWIENTIAIGDGEGGTP